ncbi:hypothetical protein LINGRAHAP2_LOCUS22478 [Linum grandiflorum]
MGGCGAGVAIQRDGALSFQLGGARESMRRHRGLDGAPTGLGVGALSIHRPEDTRRPAQRPRRLGAPTIEEVEWLDTREGAARMSHGVQAAVRRGHTCHVVTIHR